MSQIWDEIIKRLELKTKSGVNILKEVGETDFTIVCKFSDNIDDCLNCNILECKWKENRRWISFDDVKSLLEEIKQKYVLIERETLETILWTIQNEPSEISVYVSIIEEMLRNTSKSNSEVMLNE